MQSVMFKRGEWSSKGCVEELKKLGMKPIKKVHTTEGWFHYRIRDPKLFKRLRVKEVKGKGYKFVLGFI